MGRSPREGKGYPLQYSGLENSMDSIVHGVTKSRTRLSDFHLTFVCLPSELGAPEDVCSGCVPPACAGLASSWCPQGGFVEA